MCDSEICVKRIRVNQGLGVEINSEKRVTFKYYSQITQPIQTLFLFKYIWTGSQGSQECQKIIFVFTNKTVEFLR